MTKRIFALLLALVLVVGLLPMGALAAETPSAWDGTTVTEAKAVNGVYQIGTAAEYAWFAKQTQAYDGAKYSAKLTADIDLGGKNLYPDYMAGSETYGYSGTFDGDGHTIQGVNLTLAFTDDNWVYAGLFNCTKGATLRNLTVEGNVTLDLKKAEEDIDDVYAAGIVGQDKGSTLEGLVSKVNFSVVGETTYKFNGNTAGIVGSVVNNGSTATTIQNCENQGNVVGGNYAAGIVVFVAPNTTIRQCKNSGKVSATSGCAGGISARLNGAKVTSCVNTGDITGKTAGGISEEAMIDSSSVGCTITGCYNTGAVTTTAESWGIAGGIVGNMDNSNKEVDTKQYNKIMYCYNTGKVSKTNEDDHTYVGGVVGYASTTNMGMYLYTLTETAEAVVGKPLDTFMDTGVKTEAEMKSADFAEKLGDSFAAVGEGYPRLSWEKAEEPEVSGWDGTTVTEPEKADGVYQIGTAEELAWFGQQSQKYGDTNRTMKAKLTADIDLNNQDWAAYMIGSYNHLYAGTFEGNGHTIKGFQIYRNYTQDSSSYAHSGLFYGTSKATIQNLTLEGSVEIDMKGATGRVWKGYVAGLVAECTGTTIQNVVVDVDISLTNNDSKYGAFTTGGLTGTITYSAENGTVTEALIQNCENRGNITGGGNTGGFAGSSAQSVTIRNCKNVGNICSVGNSSGGYAAGIAAFLRGTTIEGCVNAGDVSGSSKAGGIAAYMMYQTSSSAPNPGNWGSIARNCYNLGSITCNGTASDNAAGIAGGSAGYSSKSIYNVIENCYNAGNAKVGVVGSAGSYTTVSNCYYLKGASEVGSTDSDAAKKITVKTEAEMKAKDFAATMGGAYKVRSKDFPALTWEKVSGTVDVAVTANAEHALIRILDADQNEIAANEDGTYPLETGKTYTYTARAAGYQTTTGTIDDVASAADKGFVITMAKSADYPKDLDAQWPSFRGNDENMAVVDYPTPTGADNSELLWAVKLGSTPGSPIMVDGYIYVQVGKRIVKLDRNTGSVVAEGTMVESSGYSVVPPTYGAGMIFVPQGSGRVQAFDAETLESLWTYKDPLGGQSLSSIAYSDGCVYVGFWNSEEKNANFVCLTVDDEDPSKTNEAKTALWSYTQAGGFYWAGAYVHGDYVIVGTDDGKSGNTSATANLLVFNKYTGKLVDSKTGYVGDIRSNVSYEADTDRIYFTSKGGWFYSEKIDWTTGKILEESKSVELGGMSTSTPVVYNGRAYVGVSGTSQFSAYSGHNVAVIDLNTWSIAYKAYLNGYPQTSGLVSTAGIKQDADGYVYVYFCANYTPGGIFVVKDKPGVTEVVDGVDKNGKMYAPLVFNPESPLSQYCICSPIADEYGTMYYKNDSGYVMAVSSKITGLTVEGHEAAVDGKYDDSKIEAYAELANGLRRKVSVKSNQNEDGQWMVSYTYGLDAGSYAKKTLTAPLHDFEGWEIEEEPTCDTEGKMVMKCRYCGETKTHTLAALGHDWDEGQVTKAATCTEEGVMTYTCKVCSETKTETIAKAPHDYKAVVTEVTCEGIGYTTYTCSVCGDSYVDDVVKALGHDYEEVVTAPTCEGMGYTTYTCKVCGDRYVDDIVEALGHDYKEAVTEPTCDKMGYTTHTCTRCNDSFVDTFTDALDHDFVKTVTKEPTCTEEGEMTFTCSHEGCGETYTQPIPKTAHELVETKVEATCESAGYTTYSCKNCDYSYIGEVTQPKGHQWNKGETALAATCGHEGVVKYTCAVCDAARFEVVERLADHTWDEGKVTKEATCKDEGEKTYTCTVCGTTKTEAIAKLTDHTWDEGKVTKEPTCKDEGEKTYTCTVCGTTRTEAIAKLTTHKWDGGEITKAPTCTETGVRTFTCTVCGETRTETVAKLPDHSWDGGKVTKEATCKDEGEKTYTCTVCGTTRTEAIAKVDHSWDEGKVTKEPTTVAEGEKTYTCKVCGETKTETIAKLGTCDGGENCPSRKFTDVNTSKWYHEAVDYAVVNGLFAGTSDTTFEPNGSMTRAMLVAVLWRSAGQPEAKTAASFQDVGEGRYYAKAVAWAKENGIVAGTSETTFSPNATITREQMAAILYRYAKFCGVDVSKTADLNSFPDAGKVANYARESMAWAVENGIMSGSLEGGKTYLDPKGNATRAQVASVLMRYLKTFG